jgi:hypothetical protein
MAGHGPSGLEPPKPEWVAAATDAPPRLPVTDPIRRRFRLFDGLGDYVYPEGGRRTSRRSTEPASWSCTRPSAGTDGAAGAPTST